ncbi:MAG: hypothetical protein Q8N96_06380 [Methylovulum sp.]|nr:hypothetical protein [Methylovulum sp.]
MSSLNIYNEKIKRVLEHHHYADENFACLNNQTKILVLRGLYKEGGAAQKILISFAEKTNWREHSLLHRVAKEAEVSEKEAREFLKGVLEILGFGTYIKGVHGHPSRFKWFVNYPNFYYLKNIGLAAQGLTESLKGDGIVSDEEDNDAICEDLEVKIPLPRNRKVSVIYPNDISQDEYDLCLNWFKLHVNSKTR